ncbi:MAG TPA: methionyl-tRNA formyltransferase [Gemmatimonadales bacterium]|nr:methionyl-tRNA formyltransferase [Gemmatimonadales bacterium]
MRLVFFGTPEFAVPSLRALLRHRIEIAAVVTRPDKPQGRSRSTLVPPPVKAVAQDVGLPVLQPERPVGDVFAASLRHLRADLGVVVAYGHILRPEILTIPTQGMVNVHASILPRWRGAAPVQWAILSGDAETGVSIMRMEEGLDSGPVLHRVSTPVGPDETAGMLADRLADLGATALVGVVARLAKGERMPGEPQDHLLATYAPKIDRGGARLEFADGGARAARAIRAFDPAPGAWALLHDSPVKLFGARPVAGGGDPGLVLAAGGSLVIGCGADAVEVREAQPAGKARMPVEAWVRGRGVARGDRFA